MGRGRRFDNQNKKLNIKKVLAVIITLCVIVMVVLVIKNLLDEDSKNLGKIQTTSYYPVYTQNKWGVIDSTGSIVIQPEYEEMIIIPNNMQDIFICTYDVDYTNNTYKTKVIDSKEKELYKNYDKVEAIDNYDKFGNIYYEENVLKVQKEGKYGVIDYEGKELLLCEYDSIESLKNVENSLILRKGEQIGLSDNEGNIIVEVKYQDIRPISEDYKSGYIVLNNYNKYGLVGFDGTTILEEKYEDIKDVTGNSLYYVQEEAIWKLIDETYETVLESNFDDIVSINRDNIVIKKEGKYGVINTEAEEKIPVEYEEIKYAYANTYIAKKEGKYGLITIENEQKLEFKYENIAYRETANFIEATNGEQISEIYDTELNLKLEGIVSEVNIEKGYMKIRQGSEYKYYNFKFEEKQSKDVLTSNDLFLSKKDNKYGYVDNTGKVIVDYIYDDATEQNKYGYAAVKKDGKWGSIDRAGNIVIEPIYDLEENLVIDFIGKWHLGKDLNMNYYTNNL